MSDSDLDKTVKTIKIEFPNCGVRMLHGHLRSHGICVTEERLRSSMHRTDLNGSVLRCANTIQWHRYNMAGPLSLWHIDGTTMTKKLTSVIILRFQYKERTKDLNDG